MRTIFIADAHLKEPADPNYRLMLRFLRELQGNTDALYIMGDLFDFWLGFPGQPFKQYAPLVDELHALRRSGCRLIYFEGNHDFHMGPVFREYLGAEIHQGPLVREIDGRRLYLCHGDQINRADLGYRLLRLLLHNRLTAAAVNVFPPAAAIRIKEYLQHKSKSAYHSRSNRWDYPRIILNFARELQQDGCQGLVTGHFHIELFETLAGNPFTILSLGDWMGLHTYGELSAGGFKLLNYNPAG